MVKLEYSRYNAITKYEWIATVLKISYTNLSHEFLLSFVWMKFLRFRETVGIKETKKLKLGDAQGIPR